MHSRWVLPTPLPKFSHTRYRPLAPEQVKNYVTIKQATPPHSLSKLEKRRFAGLRTIRSTRCVSIDEKYVY